MKLNAGEYLLIRWKKKSPLKSADNRIPTNWHKILVDQKVGYLFTYPPQYDAKDDALNQKLTEDLGEDYEKVIKQLAIDVSNTGRAWLHYWYQEGAHQLMKVDGLFPKQSKLTAC